MSGPQSTPAAATAPVSIPQGSVLVTDLPADMKVIYSRVIRNFFREDAKKSRAHGGKQQQQQKVGGRGQPSAAKDSNDDDDDDDNRKGSTAAESAVFIGDTTLIEESDSATIAVEVGSRDMAQKLYKRLQNVRVCGRRWKVQFMPAAQAQPNAAACLVECTLVPPGSRALAERALAAVPGFLTFADLPQDMTTTRQGSSGSLNRAHKRARRNDDDDDDSSNSNEEDEEEGDRDGEDDFGGGGGGMAREETLLASFADEGCALHARAVLSGRLIGTSGIRMFLERRC